MVDSQATFEQVQASMDPNLLNDFINQNPNHPLALFSMAEYYRLKNDHSNTNLLLERLLFLFEESFIYEFQIFNETEKRIVLEPKGEINKVFILTIYNFIDILSKKSCF